MAAKFKVASADPALVASMQEEFGLPRFVARTMVAHGVGSLEEARIFLAPDIERDWRNPYEINQMNDAVDRLERAVRNGERILVFGDFDLDGISATTVLTRGLRELGAHATPLIPKRFEEGYGLTSAAVERAKESDPQLIVTVDCGISCKEEAANILAQGIDLVITDHHEPGSMVPEHVTVVDPKCDEDCESDVLAGVGVALKVIQALGARFGQPHLWREYTDFATLGSVADLMPLVGENRALVADGIERMNKQPRPCIAALVGVCNVAGKELSSTNLSFSLIPRLNAAGRMGNADLALDLLMSDSFEEASANAAELDKVNDERRSIEAVLAERAKDLAEAVYHGQRALVVAGDKEDDWHEGVKGIVASRLVNAYGVPTLIFSIDGEEARGSGRSVGSVNLFEAVESTADILTRFGGHEAAVGVTLPADKLPEFADRLCAYMDALPEDRFHPLIEIDSLVDLDELTLANVDALQRLAPFGQENPTPRYLVRNVRLSNCRAVGANKNHLSCALTDGISTVDAIMFHCNNIEDLMACGSVVDVAFQVQIDEWRGRKTVKCMLDTIEPAMCCPALEACLPSADVDFVDQLCQRGCCSAKSVAEQDTPEDASLRLRWEELARGDAAEFQRLLLQEMLGEGARLHEAQAKALGALAEGRRTLAVMGTGRGKSLIFQLHAAKCALADGLASVFVYPLRALIADQLWHASRMFEKFGMSVACLTGQTPLEERVRVYEGLACGTVDVVLTTPEYLAHHAKDVASCARIGFVAVDEAHHLTQTGMGRRDAYAKLADFLAHVVRPDVLAVTATAPEDVLDAARFVLGIQEVVMDQAQRANLAVADHRNLRDKDSYLASLVAQGKKTIVYVNSRAGAVEVARVIRSLVPHVAMQIGFYNAGLSREERERVERLFRTGFLRTLVCTSAFGEGVNIPDVDHVVLYGMPFSAVEFNQMSGRAGRGGQDAQIHLLFGKRDIATNESILAQTAPAHDVMAQVYRELKRLQREAAARPAPMMHDGLVFFTMTDEELADVCMQRAPQFGVTAGICSCGMHVFEELGLVRTRAVDNAGVRARAIHVCEFGGKVELTDSVLYREGIEDAECFARFAHWAMSSPADALRNAIIRPILPNGASGEGGIHA